MTTKPILQVALAIFLVACSAQAHTPASTGPRYQPQDRADIALDRTDVPWQASRVEDPDNIRSF